jgi:hypothetical protein
VEDFGLKLAHQFPWAPASAVAVGLALRRRFLSDPEAPSTTTRRLQVLPGLAQANAEAFLLKLLETVFQCLGVAALTPVQS